MAKQPAYDSLKLALTDSWLRTLAPGRSLHRASALRSADGRFTLWLQDDGNLVLYSGTTKLWPPVTVNGVRLTNQSNGELALYPTAPKPGGQPWSTRTWGH